MIRRDFSSISRDLSEGVSAIIADISADLYMGDEIMLI